MRLFGKKPIVLNAYTMIPYLPRYAPIKFGTDQGVDKGFSIPLWTDIALATDSKQSTNYLVDSASRGEEFDLHLADQRGGWAGGANDCLTIKLASPWLVYCKEPIDFLLYADYMAGKNFRVAHGILNFQHQNQTNINFVIPKDEQEVNEIVLPAHSLELRYIPLSDRPVVVQTHVINQEMFDLMLTSVAPSHKKADYMTKRKQCPFVHNPLESLEILDYD